VQTYIVNLKSEQGVSFRCKKAAASVDLDSDKKLSHSLNVRADITSNYNVGLIIGASGSGKTTLAREAYGDDFDSSDVDYSSPVIDQLNESLSYDECAKLLSSVGLSSIPCWLLPVGALSNGQKARAEIAIRLSKMDDVLVVDEWTSVVDRTVAKAMSQSVQKFARAFNKKIVLVSCHYDIIEWLNPDWIIDCNDNSYDDRRLLCQSYTRKEKISFEVRRLENSKSWKMFSKYHYLSDNSASGLGFYFGLFVGDLQIGYQAFNEYVPWTNKRKKRVLHFNRTVIHPDYVGFGLGMMMINETTKSLAGEYDIFGKFSSIPVYKAMKKSDCWTLKATGFTTSKLSGTIGTSRSPTIRRKVKWWSFKYIGNQEKDKSIAANVAPLG